jgi:hypothetical protein
MGGGENDRGAVDGFTEDSDSPETGRRGKPPKGCITGLASLVSLTGAVLGVIYRSSIVGVDALSEITHWLLIGLAVGWLVRCGTHSCVGYMRRTEVKDVSPWALRVLTVTDIIFGVLWLAGAILMLALEAVPWVTAVATAVICIASFLLALFTHWAARAAGRPRASEWVYAKLYELLKPGKNTWLGWLLVTPIETPSPLDLLSTYVGSSLALLLVALALTGSAAVSEEKASEAEGAQAHSAPAKSKKEHSETAGGTTEVHPAVVGNAVSGLPSAGAVPGVEAMSKAIDLLCFPVALTTTSASTGRQTGKTIFICFVVRGSQLTTKFLVLVPSPKTTARVAEQVSKLNR